MANHKTGKEVACTYCGEMHYRRASQLTGSSGFYCRRECYILACAQQAKNADARRMRLEEGRNWTDIAQALGFSSNRSARMSAHWGATEDEKARMAGRQGFPTPDSTFESLWVEDENGCWLWQGKCLDAGYGRIAHQQTKSGYLLAHRYSYERFIGPIPKGYEIHHLCHNPSCVNPEHLQPLTTSEHRLLHAKKVAA